MDDWRGKHYSFFQNRECECFPCHQTAKPDEFNCLFCWCPLYALGENCGGNYRYLDSGVKDCSACMVPHVKGNYGLIVDRFSEVARLAARKEKP